MKRDRRLLGIALTILAILVLGGVLTLLPDSNQYEVEDIKVSDNTKTALNQEYIDARTDPKGHESAARKEEIRVRFQQAVTMLHAKQYDYAVKSLHRVLELSPRLPEAHVNMGYALIGLKQYQEAADFFNTATEINPMQINAYYGLALAYEGVKNYTSAISAMESYIHLAAEDDPHLNKARSASWEWGELLRIARSGEPAPRILGRDIETKALVDKTFGEE